MKMEFLIDEYIKKMNIQDIINYANKKGINIPYSDAMIIYSYKDYYQEFIKGNTEKIIKELKEKLSPNTFKEAYKLYFQVNDKNLLIL